MPTSTGQWRRRKPGADIYPVASRSAASLRGGTVSAWEAPPDGGFSSTRPPEPAAAGQVAFDPVLLNPGKCFPNCPPCAEWADAHPPWLKCRSPPRIPRFLNPGAGESTTDEREGQAGRDQRPETRSSLGRGGSGRSPEERPGDPRRGNESGAGPAAAGRPLPLTLALAGAIAHLNEPRSWCDRRPQKTAVTHRRGAASRGSARRSPRRTNACVRAAWRLGPAAGRLRRAGDLGACLHQHGHGPRRSQYGAVRDHVLGLHAVLRPWARKNFRDSRPGVKKSPATISQGDPRLRTPGVLTGATLKSAAPPDAGADGCVRAEARGGPGARPPVKSPTKRVRGRLPAGRGRKETGPAQGTHEGAVGHAPGLEGLDP